MHFTLTKKSKWGREIILRMYSSLSTNVYLLHITENVLEKANIKFIIKCNVFLRNGNRNTDFQGKYCNVCMSIIICNARLTVDMCKVAQGLSQLIRAIKCLVPCSHEQAMSVSCG